MPRIFYVNWFRKDAAGRWLWPGFGENCRVLKWIVERCDDQAEAVETPIGRMPTPDALDLSGLDVPAADLEELLRVDVPGWLSEVSSIEEHYAAFGDRLPAKLREELEKLKARLSS